MKTVPVTFRFADPRAVAYHLASRPQSHGRRQPAHPSPLNNLLLAEVRRERRLEGLSLGLLALGAGLAIALAVEVSLLFMAHWQVFEGWVRQAVG